MLRHGPTRKHHLQGMMVLILDLLAMGNVGYSGFGCISLETYFWIWLHTFGSLYYRLLRDVNLLDVIVIYRREIWIT